MKSVVCEKCGSKNVEVLDTRYYAENDYRRRRYGCAECGHRWSRYEISARAFHSLKIDDEVNRGKVSWWSGRKRINFGAKNGRTEE